MFVVSSRFGAVSLSLILFAAVSWGRVIDLGGGTNTSNASEPPPDFCQTVPDMSNELGRIRNQKDLNDCYGRVAADELTQYMRQKNPALAARNFQVATVEMAYAEKTNEKSPQTILSGKGIVRDALRGIQAAKNLLICDEKGIMDSNNGSASLEMLQADTVNSFISGKNQNSRLAQQEALQATNQVTALDLKKNCTEKLDRNYSVECHSYDVTSEQAKSADYDQKRQQLDLALSNHRIAGITYLTKFLDGQEGDHASSIVGREFRNGRCMYALRNSYGDKACQIYLPKFAKVCDSQKVWVPEEDLLNNIKNITYIPNQQAYKNAPAPGAHKSGRP